MVKISVIAPIYNGERFIESCIENILNQTLCDIELILVNDGSVDNTLDICNCYAKKDKRIIVLNQENQGVSMARNNGIDISNGEYICFIDCDDKIDIDYLEKLYLLAKNKDIELVCCDIECIKEDGAYISNRSNVDGYCTNLEALEELFKFRNLNWGPCGKLFRSSLIKNKIKFPDLHVYEDLSFVYKALYNSEKIFFTNQCKYYYVHYENNGAMNKFIKAPTTDVIVVADEIIEFLKLNIPSILSTSFYGIISQVIMYIGDTNKIDERWLNNSNRLYLKQTKKLLGKYRLDLIKNKTIYYKEKILFLTLSFSTKLYKILIQLELKWRRNE